MTDALKLSTWTNENGKLVREALGPEDRLRHLRNVTSSLMDNALNVWAELWQEFDERVVFGVAVLPQAKEGFKPECGWPEFLERMWLLRHYLDFAKRLSEQG